MLAIYRGVLTMLAPAFALAMLWRVVRGREPAAAIAERFGWGQARAGAGPAIWLHAASIGEVTSARRVVAGLIEGCPGLAVLITCNTATARALVAGWGIPGVRAAFAPYDGAGAAMRLLAAFRPAALVMVENELWPGRIAAAQAVGVPVLVIGARLSARSAARWAKAPGLIRPMLGAIEWLSAQDAASAQRFADLGLQAAAQGPVMDLKSLAESPAPARAADAEQILLAASTHDGEEALVLDAFQAQRRFHQLILAPRHPERGEQIARLIAARGFSMARRSAGALPGPETVFLADTLGEMPLWFARAGACIIGGSFVPKGGHNPFEPGRAGLALIHGPSVDNFADVFARLDAAGAALCVPAAALAATLDQMDSARQAAMAGIAAHILAQGQSGTWLWAEILSRAGIGAAAAVR